MGLLEKKCGLRINSPATFENTVILLEAKSDKISTAQLSMLTINATKGF
jgi:hypothetical protein